MRTVLVVEDHFLVSYELECALKQRGYRVHHAATQADALRATRKLFAQDQLAAVVCDNMLIGGRPSAAALYRQVRLLDPHIPFVVYSGFPPVDLPVGDPRLAIVKKPFLEQALSFIELFPSEKRRALPAQGRRRAAA